MADNQKQLEFIFKAQDQMSSQLASIAGKLRNLKKVTQETAQGFGNTKKETDTAQQGLKGVETQARSTSSALQGMVSVLAGIGIGVAIKSMVSDFAAFDDTMRQVGAVTESTAGELREMTELARKMGETTRFTAQESADAMKYMGMAGMETTDIMKSLPDVLNLSAAGATDLGTSADICTNVMSGFGIEADKLGQATDVLTKTFTSSNTSLTELGEAFSYAGPVANALNQDFNEVAAMLGKLGDSGIKASRAGTTLRGALSRLASPPKKAAAALDRLGVSTTDSDGKMRSLVDIIEDLEKTGASATDVLDIFGRIAGTGMVSLVQKGSASIRELTAQLDNSGGTAKRVATEMEAGLGGRLRALNSAFQELKMGLVEGVLPALEVLVSGIKLVVDAFNALPGPIKAVIGTLTILGGGLAAAALAFTPLISAFALMTTASGNGVAAAGLFGGGLTKLTDIVKKSGSILKELATNPIPLLADAMGGIETAFGKGVGAVGKFVTACGGIKNLGLAGLIVGDCVAIYKAVEAYGKWKVAAAEQYAAEENLKLQLAKENAMLTEWNVTLGTNFKTLKEATQAVAENKEYIDKLRVAQGLAKDATDQTNEALQKGIAASKDLAGAYEELGMKSTKAIQAAAENIIASWKAIALDSDANATKFSEATNKARDALKKLKEEDSRAFEMIPEATLQRLGLAEKKMQEINQTKPRAEVEIVDNGSEKYLTNMQSRLKDLKDGKTGIQINVEGDADEKIQKTMESLESMSKETTKASIEIDDKATEQVETFKRNFVELSDTKATPSIEVKEDENGTAEKVKNDLKELSDTKAEPEVYFSPDTEDEEKARKKIEKKITVPVEYKPINSVPTASHRFGGLVHAFEHGGAVFKDITSSSLMQTFARGGEILKRFASGGMKRARGFLSNIGDHITPILAEDGEFVIKKSAVNHYGRGVISAINAMTVPKAVMPQFANGGNVSANWEQHAGLQRFAFGGNVSGGFGNKNQDDLKFTFEYGKYDKMFKKYMANLTEYIDLDTLRATDPLQLDAITKSFQKGVNNFIATGNTGNADQELAQRKAALRRQYQAQIDLLEEEGNTELAAMYEQMLNELEDLITSLQEALEDLRDEVTAEQEDLVADYEEQYASAKDTYVSDVADLRDELNEVKSKRLTTGRNKNYLYGQTTAAAQRQKKAEASVNKKIASRGSQYSHTRDSLSKGFARESSRLDNDFYRGAKSDYNDVHSDAKSVKTDDNKEMRSTYNSYRHNIMDLQIELAKELQDLIDSWISTDIGSQQTWFKKGGLVKSILDNVKGFATGGVITGGTPGKDSVLIKGMPGEGIIKEPSMRKLGKMLGANAFDLLNRAPERFIASLRGVPGFADGGVVSQTPALADAAAAGSDWGTVNIALDGQNYETKMRRTVLEQMNREAAKLKRRMSR